MCTDLILSALDRRTCKLKCFSYLPEPDIIDRYSFDYYQNLLMMRMLEAEEVVCLMKLTNVCYSTLHNEVVIQKGHDQNVKF
jgi:hypothetical protein